MMRPPNLEWCVVIGREVYTYDMRGAAWKEVGGWILLGACVKGNSCGSVVPLPEREER